MIAFIVFLPLAGFLYCAFLGKLFGDRNAQLVTNILLFVSTILSWIIFFRYLGPTNTTTLQILNWLMSGTFSADWSLRVDALTATMLIAVSYTHLRAHET